MEKKIETTREELAKIEEGLRSSRFSKERGVSYTNDPRRTSLLRIKIKDSAMLASDEEEVRKLRILAESSRGACVSVIQEIYPGVIINMDELKLALKIWQPEWNFTNYRTRSEQDRAAPVSNSRSFCVKNSLIISTTIL